MIDNAQKRIIALGYFDCVHVAHRQILGETRRIAASVGVLSAAVTFSDNVKSTRVYDFEERKTLLGALVDDVISFEFTEKVKNTLPDDYLNMLKNEYGAVGFVCGYDHKFGKNAEGNCEFLRDYCKRNGLILSVIDKYVIDNEEVSATKIKQLLQFVEIEKANKLLVTPYHITDTVVRGRGEGHLFGFPTINFMPKMGKILPKTGVYSTMSDIVLGKYKSVTNVGTKPTFNDDNKSVETFIGDGFNGDLYGKTIVLYFYKYLRDVKKFSNPESLRLQILEDIRR